MATYLVSGRINKKGKLEIDLPAGIPPGEVEVMITPKVAPPPFDESDPAYQAAVRELRPKLYRMAREYWQSVGDAERLALTDAQLDEQFWRFDTEDIPRLKSEQGKIVIPPDPMEAFIGIFADSDITDGSMTVNETVRRRMRRKLNARPD